MKRRLFAIISDKTPSKRRWKFLRYGQDWCEGRRLKISRKTKKTLWYGQSCPF